MANFSTKFDVGAHVVSIDKTTMKVTEFNVGRISAYLDNDGKMAIWYHPMKAEGYPAYGGVPEEWCFPSTDDLLKHIMEGTE